jgi:hypothetical protein
MSDADYTDADSKDCSIHDYKKNVPQIFNDIGTTLYIP